MSYFMIAAAVITVAAGAMEASNQRKAGKANQQIAENNAKLADESAKDTAIQSARESQQQSWRTRAIIGQQRAAIASSGVDSSQGSAFAILDETALFGGANQSAISQDAARKAWGFGAEALNYRNQGKQEAWAGKVQGQTTLLRSFGSAAGMMSGAGGKGGGGGMKTTPSTTHTAPSGMNYKVPTTASGAGWHNGYRG